MLPHLWCYPPRAAFLSPTHPCAASTPHNPPSTAPLIHLTHASPPPVLPPLIHLTHALPPLCRPPSPCVHRLLSVCAVGQ